MNKRWMLFLISILLCIPCMAYSAELFSLQTDTSLKYADNNTLSRTAPGGAEPLGTSKKGLSSDIFGRQKGYVHPFLSVTGYYTDNTFNANRNKQSDFVTVLSPGIWLTVPHVKEKLLSVDTSSISPGGLSLSRYTPEFFRRYQAYVYYNADIEIYSRHSAGNAVSHKAEGFFQYNLRGGLSADLMDQYISSNDAFGTGLSTTKLDKYITNLADLVLTYNTSGRFKFRVDYSNFLVDYTASRNSFRDRDDNAVSAYVFYKIKPKTSIFVQYGYVDIRYDKGTLSNSNENHFFGGVAWDITEKSKGSIKAGYGIKSFDYHIKTNHDFILEAQIDHKFTPKTSIILHAWRKTEETNISATEFILANAVGIEYLQRLTGKLTGYASFFYEHDTYEGALTFNGQTKIRKDDYLRAVIALQYQLKEWLKTDLGYIFSLRDSSFSEFNYTNNSFFLRVTGSL